MRKIEKNAYPLWTILFLAVSILPSIALVKISERISPGILFGYIFLLWVVTVFVYWNDKKKAQEQRWRTPESTLHILEFLGGWGAAFWAQRFFRHKIRKINFQITFWIIACVHQFIAFDFLGDWEYSERLINTIATLSR